MWFSKQEPITSNSIVDQMVKLLRNTKTIIESGKIKENKELIIIGEESSVTKDLITGIDLMIHHLEQKTTNDKLTQILDGLKIHKANIYVKESMGQLVCIINAISNHKIWKTSYKVNVWARSECLCVKVSHICDYIFSV